MRAAMLLALLLGVTGCITPGLIRELAKDNATLCTTISSVWGTVGFARTNITSGDVKCGALEVHSPGEVVVPVTVKAVPTP